MWAVVLSAILVVLPSSRQSSCTAAPSGGFCTDTSRRSEQHKRTLDAANEWVHSTAKRLRFRTNFDDAVWQHVAKLTAFSARNLPEGMQRCPIFYPFSGVDLTTLHGFFPNASEAFMMAALPLGNFSCFLSASCRNDASNSVYNYLATWADKIHHMSFSGTGAMLKAFNGGSWNISGVMCSKCYRGVGLLPTLLVSMHLLTVDCDTRGVCAGDVNGTAKTPLIDDFEEHARHPSAGQDHINFVRLTWRGCGAQLSFLSTWLELSEDQVYLPQLASHTADWTASPVSEVLVTNMRHMSHALGLGERLRTTMFKAAEYMHARLLIDPGVARWILDMSAVTIHDETGLRPIVYDHPLVTRGVPWTMRSFGDFGDFVDYPAHDYPGAPTTAAEETELLRNLSKVSPPLGFPVGYHLMKQEGLLMVAWRTEMQARDW